MKKNTDIRATLRFLLMVSPILFLLLVACKGRQEHMRERLQYVSACNRADTVFTQRWLPTVDSLVSYFAHHGSANDRMMAHYVAGRVHHDMGEAPQALDCYQRAAEQADTTRADCDYYTLTALYGQMATLFHIQYLPSDEMQALLQSEYYARKDHDTLAAVIAYDLRSRPYYLRNDTDSVLAIEQRARELYLKYGYKEKAARSLPYTISILLDRHLYHEADSCMQIYEQESGLFNERGEIESGREVYYYDKGRYLLAVHQGDSALKYFRMMLGTGNDEAAYKGLLMTFEKAHIPDSISKYANLFATANDASYAETEQALVHQTAAMYDYSRQQQIAEKKSSDLKRLKLLFFIAIAIFIIVVLGVTIILLKKKLKAEERVGFLGHKYAAQLFELARNKSEKDFIEQHYKEILTEKESCETILREKIRKYEAANDHLNKDYATSVLEMKRLQTEMSQIKKEFYLASEDKSKLIDDLREKLRKQSETIEKSMVEDKLLSFFDSDEYKVFDRCRRYTKNYTPPTLEDWEKLLKLFKKHFTRYYLFLIQEETLTENQLRLCVLLRLNFTESEIMLIMELGRKQAVTKMKSQVNEQLFKCPGARSLKTNLKAQY